MNPLAQVTPHSLPQGKERAVAYCFVCKQRWPARSMKAATAALDVHRTITNHQIGSVMGSALKPKRKAKS